MKVQGLNFVEEVLALRVEGLEFWVECGRFRLKSLWIGVWGLGFRV